MVLFIAGVLDKRFSDKIQHFKNKEQKHYTKTNNILTNHISNITHKHTKTKQILEILFQQTHQKNTLHNTQKPHTKANKLNTFGKPKKLYSSFHWMNLHN